MRILVTNLTDSLRTIAIPSQNGKITGRPFAPGETHDIGLHCSPWILDEAIGAELRELRDARPPKVRISVEPDSADFGQAGIIQTGTFAGLIETVDSVKFDLLTDPMLVLRQIRVGNFIESVSILVDHAFDDPTAYAQIGTFADPQAYLSVNSNGLSKSGSYVNTPIVPVAADDFLILTTHFGAATQGSAYAFFRVRNTP